MNEVIDFAGSDQFLNDDFITAGSADVLIDVLDAAGPVDFLSAINTACLLTF